MLKKSKITPQQQSILLTGVQNLDFAQFDVIKERLIVFFPEDESIHEPRSVLHATINEDQIFDEDDVDDEAIEAKTLENADSSGPLSSSFIPTTIDECGRCHRRRELSPFLPPPLHAARSSSLARSRKWSTRSFGGSPSSSQRTRSSTSTTLPPFPPPPLREMAEMSERASASESASFVSPPPCA